MPARAAAPLLRLAASVLLLALPAPAPAAHADRWEELVPAGTSPPARRDAALAHDRERGRVVLFGGRAANVALDDTWELDLATGRWRELASAGPRPPARFSMVAGVDAARRRLVISTGQGAGFFEDAWSFDLERDAWSELAPGGAPPLRRYGAAGGVHDPGGFVPGSAALHVSHGFTDLGRFDDTRALRLDRDAWEDATPAGPLPLKRCLHGAAPAGPGRLVIHAGCASGFGPCPLDDTWLLDEATGAWTDLSGSVRPPARLFPSLAPLGDGPLVALFGGSGRNDVWILDTRTGLWSERLPAGPAPAGREGASLVWVDGGHPTLTGGGCGLLLVFGGMAGGVDRNDVWLLRPARLPPPPVVRAVRRGGVVELSWTHDPGVEAYEVWRGPGRRLVPGDPLLERLPGDPAIAGTSASVVDAAPAGSVSYAVRLASCSGD